MSKLFKHPKGLYTISFIEVWERFSYYGMRFCFVLYMMKELLFSQQKSSYIYGLFCSFSYFAPLICGYIVDKYIGLRKAIALGSFFRCFGLLLLSTGNMNFFISSLFLIVLATGLMRAGMNPLVGLLYEKNSDAVRDAGFRFFYIFANVGAFFSTIICGYIGQQYGYKYAFLIAGISILIGQIGYFLTAKKTLGDLGLKPISNVEKNNKAIKDIFLTKTEKIRLFGLFLIVFVFVTVYDICYEQQGNTLTVFVEDNVDRKIGNFTIPTPWLHSINPIVIWLLTPLIGSFWDRKALKVKNIDYVGRFSFGLFLMGISYLILTYTGYFVGKQQIVSMLWIILICITQTIGEIYVFPTTSSLVAKLAPKRFLSLCFGLMSLEICLANFFSGLLGGLYSYMSNVSFFSIFTIISFGFGLLLIFLKKPINNMIHVKD